MTILRAISAVSLTLCLAAGALAQQPADKAPPPPQPKPAEKTPAAPEKPAAEKLVYIQMSTSLGDIFVELNNEKAPISVANFLKYTEKHAYDGTIIHRVVPKFVVQGGGRTPDLKELPSDKPIKNEWTNGLKNARGTIAMARDADPDSATREFYFNLVNNDKLDRVRPDVPGAGPAGYAVFGKVIAGMDVVDKIAAVKIHDVSKDLQGVPDEPVVIKSVVRITKADADKAIKNAPEAPKEKKPDAKPPAPPPEKKK
jgi:peptidyl-prolyl cis-trans isomerase A (cyclophilin A)